MEDMKKLNNEELEKVSGAGGDMSYHLQYLFCPRCGLQVGLDEYTPINTYYKRIHGSSMAVDELYCSGCGYEVGAGYFAGEKD